ncbi:MAG: hypothetical protein A2091_00490 [Desulfuromonadales bacterium GWD2_61_12]|nr:MAG: hypothetical protein A2005_08515 [Desulfuromonadales bacterium GWC2_61_20]OGR32743.1 MAG: hypothetical protein A2091_00490 [Desulfuromonadales bacterium GWD2_61_12]
MLRRVQGFIVLLLVVGLWLAPGVTQAGVVTVRADEWCPYNCAPDAAKPGYMIEVLKLIFAKAGHTVDYQQMNWARSIEEARIGKITAIVGAVVSDAEDLVYPKNAFGMSANGFCLRQGEKWSYRGVKSFDGKVLGVIRDYSYDDEEIDGYIEANKKNDKKIQISSGENALELSLRKLAKGRVDLVIDDSAVLQGTVQDLGLAGELSCAASGEPDPVYVAFSPKDPKAKEYAALFDKGIEELRRDGTLKKILAGYGLHDWK